MPSDPSMTGIPFTPRPDDDDEEEKERDEQEPRIFLQAPSSSPRCAPSSRHPWGSRRRSPSSCCPCSACASPPDSRRRFWARAGWISRSWCSAYSSPGRPSCLARYRSYCHSQSQSDLDKLLRTLPWRGGSRLLSQQATSYYLGASLGFGLVWWTSRAGQV